MDRIHTSRSTGQVEDELQFCERFPALEEGKTPYYSFMMPMDYLVMIKKNLQLQQDEIYQSMYFSSRISLTLGIFLLLLLVYA